MNNKTFEKANEIKGKIDHLTSHLGEIESYGFKEGETLHLLLRSKYSNNSTLLKDEFVPISLVKDYCDNIQTKIADLEKQFKEL